MGGSSSSPPPPPPSSSPPTPQRPTPLPPCPPIDTMIIVNFIDIDGRPIIKEVNLDWSFSCLVKVLSSVYEDGQNLMIQFNGKKWNYNEHKDEKLRNFGFQNKANVDVLHEQKNKSPINVVINGATSGNRITISTSPMTTYKEFCRELERNHGFLGIENGAKDVISQSKFLSYTYCQDKTLRELGMKHLGEVTVVDHWNGGLMPLAAINA